MAATTPPLTLGEILDRTIQLYRRNFLLFVGISAAPAAIDIVISGLAGIYFTSHLTAFSGTKPAGIQAVLATILVAALFLLVGVPVLLSVFGVALSALNNAASQLSLGKPATVHESFAYGFKNFWRNVGILFLQFLFAGAIPAAVFIGIVFAGGVVMALLAKSGPGTTLAVLFGFAIIVFAGALFVGAVLIWLRFCLAFPVSGAEGKKAWNSLQRSARLTKGSRGRIFVMYLLVAILTFVVYYVLIIPLDLALGFRLDRVFTASRAGAGIPVLVQVGNLFISFLERAFVMPIFAIALVLFYNDQRTRQEGYDIEQLMTQAGWSDLPAPQSVAAGPASYTPPAPVSPALPALPSQEASSHEPGPEETSA